uniref:Major facilitator superfamily (MFS) profile domain-containing protein n=1 Tax=Pristionchus pacificus TaxID=54126 RepID=A0A8R1V354_PRIPA
MAQQLDLVRHVGMPDELTRYTVQVIGILSLAWTFAALPAMIPAFIAPPTTDKNGSIIDGFHTIIEEFNLSSREADYTMDLYFLASLLLGWIPCLLSDKYGRKISLVIASFSTGCVCLLCAFAPNYPVFLVGRFLQGALFSTLSGIGFVFVSESLPFSCHGRASIVFSLMWCVGYIIMAPLASFFPDWRILHIAISIPIIIYGFVLIIWTKESLAFLVSNRQFDKVADWVTASDRVSRAKFDRRCLSQYEQEPLTGEKSDLPDHSVLSAFTDPKIVKPLVIMTYMWVTDFIVYNGLSLTSTTLAMGDPHWNYTASGLVEIPASIFLPLLMDLIGRRPSVILTHALTGTILAILPFIPANHDHMYLSLWMISKFGVSASFFALYIYAAELFPVEHRSLCVGTCCALGNIGALLVPFIAKMSPLMTFSIYACVSLVSCLLTLLLPETSH